MAAARRWKHLLKTAVRAQTVPIAGPLGHAMADTVRRALWQNRVAMLVMMRPWPLWSEDFKLVVRIYLC